MRFLHLIEQYYAIGLAANSLGQLAALVISDISRRRTDQSRRGELLLILTHINTRHHVLVVK